MPRQSDTAKCIHGPGFNFTNLSITKDIHFTPDNPQYVQLLPGGFNVINHANSAMPTSVMFSSEGNAGSVSRPRHSTRRQGLLLTRLIRGRMEAQGRLHEGRHLSDSVCLPSHPEGGATESCGGAGCSTNPETQGNFYKISYHTAKDRSRQTNKTFICNDLTQEAGCPQLAHRLHLPKSTHCITLRLGCVGLRLIG